MKELLKWIDGKRTFGIVALILIFGTLQGLNIMTIPNEAYVALGALGLAFLRAGVNKVAEGVKPPKKK